MHIELDRRTSWLMFIVGATATIGLCSAVFAHNGATSLAHQATAGQAVYTRQCAACHGPNLEGRDAPALSGENFEHKWAGSSVHALFTKIRTMPPGAPNSLNEQEYLDVTALVLHKMAVPPGPEALPTDPRQLKSLEIPDSGAGYMKPSADTIMPPPPTPTANPLDKITRVAASDLRNPPRGSWLTWRRAENAQGFSPLEQITKKNVDRLQVAWSWSLPNGANEVTPLVHAGVLFVSGHGDVVQALDARTGDLLWQYSYDVPKDVLAIEQKALAIYDRNIFMATSDGHVIALDVRTGALVWEAVIGAPGKTRMVGGPLVANGKVIIGGGAQTTSDFYAGFSGFIVALDAVTGKEVWRFQTVAGENDPGRDSWNDMPFNKRTGASVWTPGSYDSDLNLIFFGTGNTYVTGALQTPANGSKSTADALYTDTTLALEPDTGKLVWYYQHMPNDLWDLDWAFERSIVDLQIEGKPVKAVITAGKAALHDILDAKTGKYLFSVDAGIQNIITAVDPGTGAKTYDPAKRPGASPVAHICPNAIGGRNWMPSSLNPVSKILYVPIVESCMKITRAAGDGKSVLSQLSLAPSKNSDGRYGRLQAIDLATRKTLWMDRRRAPVTSGTLSTSGGLVFAGYFDRTLAAYDDATGKRLWDIRLNEVPNSAPISYEVDGKQYIAVVVGMGGGQSVSVQSMVPEIRNPAYRASSIWVFTLPE